MAKYNLYTDGKAVNKESGGFGCLIIKEGKNIGEEYGAANKSVTVNRMRLFAVLIGLRKIPDNANVIIVSDDEYTVKATLSLSKRNHNTDILELIDNELKRLGKAEYRWISDKNTEDKLRQKYCKNLAQKGVDIQNYINIADYFPARCKEKSEDAVTDEEEAMQLITNMEKEIRELKNYLKRKNR